MSFYGPPLAGDDTATLLGSLERQRATFAWKAGGLDAAGLRVTVGASTITLGGLVKHLTAVESLTFNWKFLGRDPGEPWNAIDWDADPDWPWHSAAADPPEELYAMYHDAVARSRALMDELVADGGLDQLSPRDWPGGDKPSLRRIVVDHIEEYARHTGHADLIREAVDGLVGEDPPGDELPYASRPGA